MPKIADLEYTPNPNARKFVLKEPLTSGLARSFENGEQAQRDELATKLFAIPHVTNVFYIDNWITVTQDGDAFSAAGASRMGAATSRSSSCQSASPSWVTVIQLSM